MSIFKKDCPECATSNSVDAVRCSCGYCFDPDALAGADANEYAEEQRRLYQDYLGARIVQAEVELRVAREQAAVDPNNTYLAAAALVAEQALNALQAEMQQLNLRPAVTRATANPARPAAAAKAPASPVMTSVPPVARAPAGENASKSAPRVVTPPSRPASVSLAPKPKAQEFLSVAPPSSSSRPLPATANLKSNRTAPAAKASPLPAARPTKPAPAAPAAPHSAKPGPTFRTAQARKAAAITRSHGFSSVAKVKRALSSVVSALTPAPALIVSPTPARAPVATRECPSCTAAVANNLEKCSCGYVFSKAAQEMPGISLAALKSAGKDTQECPSCTAAVPLTRERCNCGYTFAKPTEHVPALTLDAGALAILTDGIKPNNSSRRR